MKSIKLLAVLLLGAALTIPMYASAGETHRHTGTIVGHKCALSQELCPLNHEEHLASEPDFVLVKENGLIYPLHNLPRDTKVRHINQTVVLTGAIDANTNGIYVNQLADLEGNKIWSWEDQTKEGRPYYGLGLTN